ncbi:amino acid adenylation domain-containing protein (plasmid) [Streptomyces sp. NBC_01351]|uniref:non-ribosomal peptide synthetase n=1 Tax=Streptomyces sp. NBC_01351 TaxID=2903833 RepID=UPI002E319EA7|nr:amino acid adenylation domain-containing protein [Streptomyces sp. NBC_01351]
MNGAPTSPSRTRPIPATGAGTGPAAEARAAGAAPAGAPAAGTPARVAAPVSAASAIGRGTAPDAPVAGVPAGATVRPGGPAPAGAPGGAPGSAPIGVPADGSGSVDPAGGGRTRLPRWVPVGSEPGPAVGAGFHEVSVEPALAQALAGTAAALGIAPAALLGAAHARVLATVAAERELRTGLADGPGVRELRLTVAPSGWAELAGATAAALAGAAPAVGPRPEVVLDLAGDTRAPLGEGEVLRVLWSSAVPGLRLRLRYDPRALDAAYADRLAGYHLTALRLLTEDPYARHDRQSLLSPQEVEGQIHGLAGPRAELPDAVLTDLFEERVRRHPDAVAAEHGARGWTYRQLDAHANRVAHALLAAGSRPHDVVAVVMDRSLDWIAAALGVLKAGAVYLPMGPELPVDRISAQLTAAGASFVLAEPGTEVLARKAADAASTSASASASASTSTSASVPTPPAVICVRDVHTADLPDDRPGVRVRPDHAAYVYFTSGSTGDPKGALCEHAGLLNHLLAKAADMGMADGGDTGSGEVVAQTAPQSFDISLWQFAAPLLTGGTTRIVATDVLLDVDGFLDEIVEGHVTIAQTVPAYLEVLVRQLEHRPRDLGALRSVSVTGEVLAPALVRRWFALCPGISLVNAYGATEVCDDTMHEVLDRAPEPGLPVALGRSLPNVNTYVLNENLGLVPLGSAGEIAFSGVCVGRGYVNDEERTQQVFVSDPFRAGTRMYRTGDFGRWLPDGRMEYLGRHDEQVKIRGFRIELGEIETRLLALPGVREAAVVIVGDAGIHRHLVAFFTTDDDGEGPGVERARGHLASVLPDYMVPSYLHPLRRLPRTANGKADKKALVELASTLGHGGDGHTGPATATERRLAMLWAEVLGVPLERIGRHDDFFALGASSLAAVRVVVRLDRALSVRDLVAHPVLADVAALLDGRRDGGLGDGRDGLRAGGPREAAPPLLHPLLPVRNPHHTLVCLPYAGGSALNFRALATELEREGIAVLGAELPGHDFAAEDEPLEDVAALAARARDEILAQTTTPVLLWGHCSGAALALETARLLQEAGRPAERVFIGGQLLHGADALRAEVAEVAAVGPEVLLGRLRADNAYVELDAFTPERAAAVDRAYRHDVITANRHLLRILEAPGAHRIDAPVEVVVARDDAWTAAADLGYQAWRAVSDRVTLHELEEGGHYFTGTRAAETADVVRRTTG